MEVRKRTIKFVCVVCGACPRGDKYVFETADANRRPNETLKIVRCERCTRNGVPLPK